MKRIKMKVIGKPTGNSTRVFEFNPNLKTSPNGVGGIKGQALFCGNCGSLVIKWTKGTDAKNVVYKCHSCGSYNEMP